MADEHPPLMEKKPSFVSSVMSGLGGYVKGAITAGLAGGAGGAVIGAVIAGITLATGGAATVAAGALAVAGGALIGAGIGAAVLAPLGAVAGLVTGVVKSREAGQPSAQDIVNVAKVSFAQGMQVGHQIEHVKHHGKGRFEQAYAEEKNRTMLAERQVSH